MPKDSIPDPPADDDIEGLVGEWLTVPDIAERMGLRLSDVRQIIEDRLVLSVRIGPRNVVSVPAKFFNDEGPLPELPGTFTVLGDSRMTNQIVAAIIQRQGVLWVTRNGAVSKEPMPVLKTVEAVLQDPEPDQSWMSTPMPRAKFTHWLP